MMSGKGMQGRREQGQEAGIFQSLGVQSSEMRRIMVVVKDENADCCVDRSSIGSND